MRVLMQIMCLSNANFMRLFSFSLDLLLGKSQAKRANDFQRAIKAHENGLIWFSSLFAHQC
jgi:hypothetical protein